VAQRIRSRPERSVPFPGLSLRPRGRQQLSIDKRSKRGAGRIACVDRRVKAGFAQLDGTHKGNRACGDIAGKREIGMLIALPDKRAQVAAGKAYLASDRTSVAQLSQFIAVRLHKAAGRLPASSRPWWSLSRSTLFIQSGRSIRRVILTAIVRCYRTPGLLPFRVESGHSRLSKIAPPNCICCLPNSQSACAERRLHSAPEA